MGKGHVKRFKNRSLTTTTPVFPDVENTIAIRRPPNTGGPCDSPTGATSSRASRLPRLAAKTTMKNVHTKNGENATQIRKMEAAMLIHPRTGGMNMSVQPT